MHLSTIQRQKKEFEKERGWDKFSAAEVFVHLVEEIGEIGRCILYDSGYKKEGLGHSGPPREVEREFAQSLSLLIQLANRQKIDLERAYIAELALMKKRFLAKEWKAYTADLNRRSQGPLKQSLS